MKEHSTGRLAVIAALILLVVVLGAVTAARALHLRESVARGRALFNGEVPLVGRITGQSDPLPTAAIRCANCHTASGETRIKDRQASSFAVPLNRAALTELRSRRGGPASRFDESTMCVLIRSGIDPAHIIIPQAMPRYDIADQDCAALWDYL